jgi:hypothetical protein
MFGIGFIVLFRHQASLGGVNILALYLQDKIQNPCRQAATRRRFRRTRYRFAAGRGLATGRGLRYRLRGDEPCALG